MCLFVDWTFSTLQHAQANGSAIETVEIELFPSLKADKYDEAPANQCVMVTVNTRQKAYK